MSALIEFEQVCKYYQMGDTLVKAADHITMKIEKGEFVAIVGQSGSGKSTCMNIIGCLDVPTYGTYRLNGRDVGKMNRNELAAIRNEMLGFIFQQYNLLPRLNLLENVEVPLVYANISRAERHKLARDVLEKVGLGDKLKNLPNQLSGGQQQRVSIARALAGNPAASASVSPSPVPSSAIPTSSLPTSRPVLWTPTPAARSSGCFSSSTERAIPWCSLPTTIPSPCRRSVSSVWRTDRWCMTATPTRPRPSCSPLCPAKRHRRKQNNGIRDFPPGTAERLEQ